jgi:hypothetical protein
MSRTVQEPANRGLLVLPVLILAGLLLAACNTTTHYQHVEPVRDLSADTGYDLTKAYDKLQDAYGWQYQGKRAAAAAVFGAAIELLEGMPREQDYVRLMCASMWAEPGEGFDSRKAMDLLSEVRPRTTADTRFHADYCAVEAVLAVGSGDAKLAGTWADTTLELFERVEARASGAEFALQLAYRMQQQGWHEGALRLNRSALATARAIGDDYILIDACIALAVYDVQPKPPETPEQLWTSAYEAAYRLDDMQRRNLVIASAVQEYARLGNDRDVIRWGERLRDQDRGDLPDADTSGLHPLDHAYAIAHYALALHRVSPKHPRLVETLQAARLALDELGDEADAEAGSLALKVSDSLLKLGAGK